MNETTYRLELLAHVKMHLVFHVSFLKKALSRFDNALPWYVDVQEVEQEVHDPIGILDEKSRRLRNRERERETTAQTPRFFTNDDVFGQQISR